MLAEEVPSTATQTENFLLEDSIKDPKDNHSLNFL